MRLLKIVRKITKKLHNRVYEFSLLRGEKAKMKDPRRIKLYNSVNFTKKQESEIQEYFKKYYGKKIDTRWHKLYQSFTGNFDKKYFPEILFSSKLEPLLSDMDKAAVFTDKSMVELLYKDIDDLYIPKTTVLCCSGIFYDSTRTIISKSEALELLNDCGEKIFKKTIDSSSGRGVLIVNIEKGMDVKNNLTLEQLLSNFSNNFIVQELVTNCKELKNIYSKSLNTFRVITYTIDGKLYHMPLVLRIGKKGNEVDNIHAGGLFIGLSDNGELKEKAYTEFQEVYTSHPDSNTIFKGYKIHGVQKIIDIAYKCHGKTPHLRMISWDFTIDDMNRIVLIEVNLNGQSIWFPQMANGVSAFEDNTEYMLNLISNKK